MSSSANNNNNNVKKVALRNTKMPVTYYYTTSLGKKRESDNFSGGGVSVSGNSESENKYSKNVLLFDGICYHCGYANHSQNYCPLKLCTACGVYGHDQRVCFFKSSSKYRKQHIGSGSCSGSCSGSGTSSSFFFCKQQRVVEKGLI
jgi:hypothetical protein